MADDNHEEKDDRRGGEADKDPSAKPVLALLGVFFIPALILGLTYYGMLRWGRLRKSIIGITILIVDALAIIYALLAHPLDKFKQALAEPTAILDNWGNIVPLIMVINVILGGIVGYVAVRWSLKQMEDNPHLLALKGNWMYNFEFRRTPKELMKRKEIIQRLKNGSYESEERSPLGLDENSIFRPAFRYASEARKHMFIIGGSGSGKTITMQSLIKCDIDMGMSIVGVDMKRSPEFAAKLAAWAKENGRNFYHFVNGKPENYDIPNSPGQSYYDPLAGGSPTTRADMLLGMRAWDDTSAVYKSDMQQLLQTLFGALDAADRGKTTKIDWNHGGIYMVASAISGNNLTELAMACEGTESQFPIEEIAKEYADAKHKGRLNQGIPNAIVQLQGQMRTIVASEYGRWMRTAPEGRAINLFELTKESGNVVLFSLNSDSEPEFAKYVGSMIMADLTSVSAKRRQVRAQNQFNIYIDEFQTLNMATVNGLLEKARESFMAITLAQQSFEQVIAASPRNGEAQLGSIMDTCSNFIVHAGSTHDSAERLSKIIGMESYEEYATSGARVSGFFSNNFRNKKKLSVRSETKRRWKFEPERFMSLSMPDPSNGYKTTAVLVNKKTSDPAFSEVKGGLARELWMIPPDAVLREYYNGIEPEETTPVNLINFDKEEEANEHSPKPLSDDDIPTRVHVKKAQDIKSLNGESAVAPSGEEKVSEPRTLESFADSDDDGGFSFSEVADGEKVQEGFVQEDSTAPISFDALSNLGTSIGSEEDDSPSPLSANAGKRSSLKETKFEKQMREHKEKEAALEREAIERRKKAREAKQAAKQIPSGGLPKPPVKAPQKPAQEIEDTPLPSLDELY